MLREEYTGYAGSQSWRDRRPVRIRNRNRRKYLQQFAEDLSTGVSGEFEHRIWTACMTDRVLSDPDKRFQGNRPLQQSVWREAVKEWSEYGAEEIKTRFKPSRAQVADWETVMSWCATLDKKDFRIIWLRSCGFFFTEIADRMLKTWVTRLSDTAARNRYREAMLRLYNLSRNYQYRFILI